MLKTQVLVEDDTITFNIFDDDKTYKDGTLNGRVGFLASLIVEYQHFTTTRNKFVTDIVSIINENTMDAKTIKKIFPDGCSLIWEDAPTKGAGFKQLASKHGTNYTFVCPVSLNTTATEKEMSDGKNIVEKLKKHIFSI